MDIYLSFNNLAEVLRIPVLPQEFKVVTGLNNKTVEVIGLGELGIIGNRKLHEIVIESFFPKEYSSYCRYKNVPTPYDAVGLISKWRDTKRPIRLNITETPINIPCMIEEWEHGQKGGQPGDIYYSLKLKEYRFINIRTIKEEGGQLKTNDDRPNEREVPATYIVKSGDNLLLICKRLYGGGGKLNEFYEKNKGVIGSDPDLIKPGQVLMT